MIKDVVLYERKTPINKEHPFADLITNGSELDKFNSDLLNLGNINVPSESVESVACFFDLQGFTNFTNQDSPELILPTFMNEFITWIFSKYKELNIEKTEDGKVFLYAPFPFIAKFMGDGMLLIWNINMDSIKNYKIEKWEEELNGDIGNLISILLDVTKAYSEELYPKLSNRFTGIPPILRCGISRGTIFSIGNGSDFVGPCLNKAARLQKLSSLSFAISAKGINDNKWFNEKLRAKLIVKKVTLRGIGDEIVFVLKDEFNKLSSEAKREFFELN